MVKILVELSDLEVRQMYIALHSISQEKQIKELAYAVAVNLNNLKNTYDATQTVIEKIDRSDEDSFKKELKEAIALFDATKTTHSLWKVKIDWFKEVEPIVLQAITKLIDEYSKD